MDQLGTDSLPYGFELPKGSRMTRPDYSPGFGRGLPSKLQYSDRSDRTRCWYLSWRTLQTVINLLQFVHLYLCKVYSFDSPLVSRWVFYLKLKRETTLSNSLLCLLLFIRKNKFIFITPPCTGSIILYGHSTLFNQS